MLNRHVDRFGRHDIRLGDTLTLPSALRGPFSPVNPPDRHNTYDVIAFEAIGKGPKPCRGERPMAHCIRVKRRSDGYITTLAAWHWLRVREAYGYV